MDLQPILSGELVELRPLKREDYEELLMAASDPLIWEIHPQPDRHKPEVFKKFFDEAIKSQGALVVIDRSTAKIIGTSRFYDFSFEKSSVLIGYTFLMREFWGGRYNRDLKRLMVNHARRSVKTVFFQVGVGNLRSQKAMLKIGAINTGVEDVAISYGPPKKSYIYKLEKTESLVLNEFVKIKI